MLMPCRNRKGDHCKRSVAIGAAVTVRLRPKENAQTGDANKTNLIYRFHARRIQWIPIHPAFSLLASPLSL